MGPSGRRIFRRGKRRRLTREERSDSIRSDRYNAAAVDLGRAIDRGAKRAARGAIQRMSRACDEHSVGGDETFDPRDRLRSWLANTDRMHCSMRAVRAWIASDPGCIRAQWAFLPVLGALAEICDALGDRGGASTHGPIAGALTAILDESESYSGVAVDEHWLDDRIKSGERP